MKVNRPQMTLSDLQLLKRFQKISISMDYLEFSITYNDFKQYKPQETKSDPQVDLDYVR